MFQFALEDGPLGTRYQQGKSPSYRMNGLRHNPYVGSFHGKRFQVQDSAPTQLVIEGSKSNPLIGVFRHSPSIPSKSLGLKSILYSGMTKPPLFSQLQVSREPKKLPPHNFLRSLRQIPTKVYSASSVGSRSERSSNSPNQPEEDENLPTCSICLNPYADGDELRTFACSHCFHNECVSKWIFHRCLDNEELASFNCPECRQNHVTLSEAGSSRTSLAEGISSLSFLQVGENLARDGGYEFLSDFGSDLQSPAPRSMPCSPRPVRSSSSATDIASPQDVGEDETEGDGITEVTGQVSPRRPIVLHNPTFGSRVSNLNRSSNRLLGIFPVPEEHSNNLADSALTTSPCPSPALSSQPIMPAVGIAGRDSPNSNSNDRIGESIFGASALLNPSDYSVSTLGRSISSASVNTSTNISTSAASSTVRQSSSAWTTQEPLCASAYSDCGRPLPRM